MNSSLLDPPPSSHAEEVRRFAESQKLKATYAALDAAPRFPWKEFQAMAAAGLLGLRTAHELGGQGMSLREAGGTLFHLAFHSGTTFAKLSLQPEFCSVLAEHGSPELVDTYFRPLTAGKLLVGNHVTEPTAGSDVRAIRSRAERHGSGYVLDGTKSEAAFCEDAQAAIVYAYVEHDGQRQAQPSAFLVPQDLPGIERRSIPDLGERWMRRGIVEYREVRIPEHFRIGEEGRALEYVKSELTRERALLGAIYLGVAWASWVDTVEYTGGRLAFGRPLSANQAVAFPLVEDGVRLRSAWYYVNAALEALDQGRPAASEADLAKWLATQTAITALDHAIQFHGGRGYSKELPHEQRWRDVRSAGLAHGPSEVLLGSAARALWPRESKSAR